MVISDNHIVIAKTEITLSHMIDVVGNYRYYLLQSSTAAVPERPTTFPPTSGGGDTLTWDGNTEGLEFVDIGDGAYIYKISDVTPTLAEAQQGGFLTDVTSGEVVEYTSEYTMALSDAVYSFAPFPQGGLVILEDNADLMGITIPEKGFYLFSDSIPVISTYGYQLTINGYTGFGGGAAWDDAEPSYTSGSTNSLYHVDCSVYSNGTFYYSPVSLSTAYEAAKEAYEKAQSALDNNAQTEEDLNTETEEIRTTLEEHSASFRDDCMGIVSTALSEYTETGDLYLLKTKLESELQQLSDSMNLRFTKTTNEIVKVNTDLQSKYNTITTYFSFNVNGLTIGQNESPYKVVIDNDSYTMFVNNVPVMWIKDGKVYTPEVEVTRAFKLLGYAIEKDSLGNVNCSYVGGDS